MSFIPLKPLLLFGKQYTKANPSRVGGVIVLFEVLKSDLDKMEVEYDVIDLNWRNYQTLVHAYFTIVKNLVFSGRRYRHLSMHGTANEFFFLAPILVFFGKSIFNRTVSLRKFGGNFDKLFKAGSMVKKWLSIYALKKSDLVFFETRYLVEFFKKNNQATFWFPNVRGESSYRANKNFTRKFVFVGQVKESKGINELLTVFSTLENGATLDIYGPIHSEYNEEDFKKTNIKYKGVINAQDVPEVLSKYNVLVLPTYHQGEGYPGIIIEAYSVGIPVIATNLRGIQEIVSENSGVLIEPKSSNQLLDAIKQFNHSNYELLSVGARQHFNNFETTDKTRGFVEKIREIVS